MHNVMVAGAGKIGSLIACLLAKSGAYRVHLVDSSFSGIDVGHLLQAMPRQIATMKLDVTSHQPCCDYIKKNKIQAIISSLPYFLNVHVAEIAKACDVHYFDLTEDIETATAVKILSLNAKKAFVPQCGLAPGFVGIAANSLLQQFDECAHAKLRVGALPQRSSNGLNYSLTWSTDGLINEYGNLCYGIDAGKSIVMTPLEGLEHIQIDGCEYEAFNTSGGLGSLGELYLGKITSLNYKTMRYPGHSEKMRFLMEDLKLNEDRATLKRILERAIPKTSQDMVLIYVAVDGVKEGQLFETSYMKKIYPQIIQGIEWTAIQISTAASVCAVMDIVIAKEKQYSGLVLQETLPLNEVVQNRFGQYFA